MMPQEIEVWYIIPAVRKELAKNLASNSLKQKEIAKILGITESAVSQYFKSKRADEIKLNSETKKLIEKSALNLKKNKSCTIKEIQKICSFIKKQGLLCKIHKSYDKKINSACGACKK